MMADLENIALKWKLNLFWSGEICVLRNLDFGQNQLEFTNTQKDVLIKQTILN